MSDYSARQSIAVAGLHHGDNPIPLASRKGPLLMSGGIFGLDPETGQVPADLEGQMAVMFANVRRIVEAAGGGVGDIVKMTIWTRDKGGKEALNREWLALFPDPASRPARHALINDQMAPQLRVQCDLTAYIG